MTQGYKQLSLLEKSNPGFMQNLYNTAKSNIGETGAGLSKAGKATLGGFKTGAKWVGKASPYVGAGVTAIDAARSFQIANELENMKQMYPNIPQEAIDFYRNKGKAISAGAGVGGIGGGILGSGVFSAPGAALGIGLGGMAGGGIYNLSQLNNKYKDYYNSPEFQKILQDYNGKGINDNSNNNNINKTKMNSGVSGQPTTQQQALALAQQLGANPPGVQQTEGEEQQSNLNAINDYVSKLQNVNQPYIDALQKLSSNYDDLVRRNFNAQRYFTAMAGLSGNQGYTRLADALNPINNEINKLNTLKALRDAQAGDINAINEVMGNLAMAQEMGLPPEAAFANKNLLTMMAAKEREANRYQIALENNLMKKYGIDRNYARALTVQAMRGQNALDVANIYTGAYTGGAAPGLNRQGGVQTPYRPLANKQQSQEATLFQQVTGH